MSTVKINNKAYPIPELTFRHLPMMEKCGLSVVEMMSKKYLFTAVETFAAIVVGCEIEQADYLLEQHILGGGDVAGIYEAFIVALTESHFFSKMLEGKMDSKTPANE